MPVKSLCLTVYLETRWKCWEDVWSETAEGGMEACKWLQDKFHKVRRDSRISYSKWCQSGAGMDRKDVSDKAKNCLWTKYHTIVQKGLRITHISIRMLQYYLTPKVKRHSVIICGRHFHLSFAEYLKLREFLYSIIWFACLVHLVESQNKTHCWWIPGCTPISSWWWENQLIYVHKLFCTHWSSWLETVSVMLCWKINIWTDRDNAMRVDWWMASVVVLLYVEHVDCVSNAVCLIYIFGVIEQIWVLMDQPLVAFEMYIVDLIDQNTKTRSEPKEKLVKKKHLPCHYTYVGHIKTMQQFIL